eukprot:8921479-Pyramimonas_sp.AAC.1
MQKDHITSMLRGFADSTLSETGGGARKPLGMSDAEESYRHALSRVLGVANLMCYFHVKQACKDYLAKRSVGTAEQKAA